MAIQEDDNLGNIVEILLPDAAILPEAYSNVEQMAKDWTRTSTNHLDKLLLHREAKHFSCGGREGLLVDRTQESQMNSL